MIRNIDQYQITKHWLTKYELTVSLLNKYATAGDALYASKVNPLNSQIEIFKEKIKEYEMNKKKLVE